MKTPEIALFACWAQTAVWRFLDSQRASTRAFFHTSFNVVAILNFFLSSHWLPRHVVSGQQGRNLLLSYYYCPETRQQSPASTILSEQCSKKKQHDSAAAVAERDCMHDSGCSCSMPMCYLPAWLSWICILLHALACSTSCSY